MDVLNLVEAEELGLSPFRLLEEADLKKLERVRGEQAAIPLTKRMTMRHHSLARCVAAGMPNWEACAITGYKPATVSLLKNDPTFNELVAFYRKNIDKEFVDLHRRLAVVSADALDLLHEKIENAPDELSPGQLMEVVKMGADRTGHGPSQTSNVNVNIDLGERLRNARERSLNKKLESPIIEGTAEIVDG